MYYTACAIFSVDGKRLLLRGDGPLAEHAEKRQRGFPGKGKMAAGPRPLSGGRIGEEWGVEVYTIKDIAAMAGVGIATVSRVLNNRPDVSDATRQKVMDIVNQYGFTQNSNAKNLKQRNAELVSILVRGRQNSFLVDMAERMIAWGKQEKQSFLLDFLDEGEDEIEAARHHIAEKKPPVLVFLGANPMGRSEEIAALGAPCVFATVDAQGLSIPGVSSVSIDNRAAASLAVGHLLDYGHRRIAVFGGRRNMDDGIGRRYLGVVDSYQARGLDFDESLYVECSFAMGQAYERMNQFLAERRDFTAVFAVSDVMAIGLMKALYDAGLHVPEDVSMVGFDGIELSRYTLPALTTLQQPAQELARETVRLAQRLVKNPQDCQHLVVPSALLHGGSVAYCRGS